MNSDLAALAARVAALEDMAAIRALKARYLRACDLKQPDVMLDTLLPDGAVIAYEGFPLFTDRDNFVAIYREMGCKPTVFDLHHAANDEIVLTDPDSATGLWTLHFQSIDTEARTVTRFGIEYQDRYLRRQGRWWIAETRSRRTSCLIERIGDGGVPVVLALGEAPAVYGETG